MKIPFKKLNNGLKMPVVGLGVWKINPGRETYNTVASALRAGYRHIDTAKIYRNEESVGRAVKDSNVPRKDIFVTTKLFNDDQGYDSALQAFNESLNRLNMEYVDLYLLHWPVAGKRLDSWRALEEIYTSGRAKAIGVSNFTVKHLEELLKVCKIKPTVNQVEFNPFLFQKELLEYCQKQNIVLEAYCPLVRGDKMNHPVIKAIADKYGKSSAQILLKWSLQHGTIVIPKSTHQERQQENIDIFNFVISDAYMKKLDSLNEDYRICANPNEIE